MSPEELLGIKNPATEETLQSIDSTLKRIEKIMLESQKLQSISFGITTNSDCNDLVEKDIQEGHDRLLIT